MTSGLARIWVAAMTLCSGIWVAAEAQLPWTVAFGSVGIGLLLLALRRRRALTLLGLGLVCLGAGALNAQLRFAPRGSLTELARQVPGCHAQGVVIETVGSYASLVDIRSLECDEAIAARKAGVVAMAEEVAAPGASVDADGWLVPLGRDGFDRSLARAGAEVRFHVAHVETIAPPRGLHALADRVRGGLDDAVRGLDARTGALLEGLTIGDTSGLSDDTLQRFRNAGLSHVLAVSGSNVAIVIGAVLAALRRVSLRTRIILGCLALGLFVLVVGPDPSVLRAAAMGSIALACLASGRTPEPLAALGLAVIAVVSLRPGLLFSVGMQLSSAATAGIVLFTAPIERALARLPRTLRLLLAATLAAQLAVAPLLIGVFGEISVVAPVSNAVALPAVAPATVVGLAAGALAVFVPALGGWLATAVAPAAAWILAVADRAGGPSWSLLHVDPGWAWPLGVAMILWACRQLRREPDLPR